MTKDAVKPWPARYQDNYKGGADTKNQIMEAMRCEIAELRAALVAAEAKAVHKQKSGLTQTQLQQLISYCEAAERDGGYYGNKAQFVARHAAIVKWLKELTE